VPQRFKEESFTLPYTRHLLKVRVKEAPRRMTSYPAFYLTFSKETSFTEGE